MRRLPPISAGRERNRFEQLRDEGQSLNEARYEAYTYELRMRAAEVETVEALRAVVVAMLEHLT